MNLSGSAYETGAAYTLEANPAQQTWEALVTGSRQGSVFSSTTYLQSLQATCTCFVVKNSSGECVAGVAIIEAHGRMHVAPFPFTPHQGILFSSSVNALPKQKRQTVEFRITEFLIHSMLHRYSNFHMALSPMFADLRPFLWHNHGAPGQPRFQVTPRYTGQLDLRDFTPEAYISGIRTVRRQEFKKSQAQSTESADIASFLRLYQLTFERQGMSTEWDSLERVERITRFAMRAGYGRLSMAAVDGQPASMSLFVFDEDCAYYLFGANDPGFRGSGASTHLMIENICHFSAMGLKKIDFVGVNSPKRGDFKLSFNAELVPYFEVHLEATSQQGSLN